ncbi:hypothetical protein MACH26_03590 [Planctobacterium marinum]|uniref:Tail specific protease domain-containing protein n=2 Tax=Planctobacterium marinum TaxID=1631968 RepID=A0AA48HD70_9ALTE|nr:hypothetical protein MACH26_03590 [Planctobacterium marinum]
MQNHTAQQYGELIKEISASLQESFVIPEVTPAYAQALDQCLVSDCLAGVTEQSKAAQKITEIMQAAHADKHLKVFAPGEKPGRRKKMASKGPGTDKPAKAKPSSPTGIEAVEILSDNTGYIKISSFPGTQASLEATREALISLQDTHTLVFDIRRHRGGTKTNISEIASFLFAQPTHMVTTQSPHVNEGKATPHVSAPNEYADKFKDKPVFVLTSERSGSAAEHFAMAIKATGRGILIGETTAGFGHWGGMVQLEQGYSLFLPVGRTYHPKTKLGWEGIGVTPDIIVPADDSLEYTLKRIHSPYSS